MECWYCVQYQHSNSNLDLLLHENLHCPSPSPRCCARPRTTEPGRKCTEHSAVQENSVQCIVAAANIRACYFPHGILLSYQSLPFLDPLLPLLLWLGPLTLGKCLILRFVPGLVGPWFQLTADAYMILKRGKCYIAFCSTLETRFRTREKYNTSLSVPHMQHAFEQGKYTSVYKILLFTPVSTPLAQHDFRTGEMYIAFHSTRIRVLKCDVTLSWHQNFQF